MGGEGRPGHKAPKLGMFPLILTVLNGDDNRGYYKPFLRTVCLRGKIPTLNPCSLSNGV